MSTHDVSAAMDFSFLPKPWQRLSALVERIQRDFRKSRELELRDGNALRDLGLHRSEYGLYLAEAVGAANPTRRGIGAWYR